jgi:hypothetical protein
MGLISFKCDWGEYLDWRGMKWWGWRKLHYEELCNLYSPPNILRMIKLRRRLARHVAWMRAVRNAYKLLALTSQTVSGRSVGIVCSQTQATEFVCLVGKLEGRRLLGLGRRRCRWVDNNKIDLGEMVWTGLVWFGIGTSGEPMGFIKCWEILELLHNWWHLE